MTPLYMLAFDHRSSFSRDLLGIAGTPTPFEARRVAGVKNVVYEGFRLAVADGVPYESAGLLVDEQYGSRIARRARGEGVVLAMPVERSGRAEFEFEFGADFRSHIEAFDPTYAKVLVRYNPEGDHELNLRQAHRLGELSRWLRRNRRKLLFELLVPAEPAQLERVGGNGEHLVEIAHVEAPARRRLTVAEKVGGLLREPDRPRFSRRGRRPKPRGQGFFFQRVLPEWAARQVRRGARASSGRRTP
jgi:hypothetical protein